MGPLKSFIKRNAPVFFLGLIITLIFLALIFAQPKTGNDVPAGFKKVEETVFEGGKPKEPEESTVKTGEYAPQVPSPENKGKPYFYGESNPNLRDTEGYPVPPTPDTVEVSGTLTTEDRLELKEVIQETYSRRISTVVVNYTVNGFEPSDIIAYTGQKVELVNTTNNQITINQTSSIHEALKNGLIIPAKKSATFRPLITGAFTYMETGSGKYGGITVLDATAPLQ